MPNKTNIPKALREDLHLQAGQQFALVARGNIIELIPSRSIKDARGMLSSNGYKHSSADAIIYATAQFHEAELIHLMIILKNDQM